MSQPLRLVIIRHGESIWNRENRYTGWTDIPLSEKGKEEVRISSHWIAQSKIRFDMAFSVYALEWLAGCEKREARDELSPTY